MTIRTCSAALILALWYSGWATPRRGPRDGTLAILVRAYRESPTPGAAQRHRHLSGRPSEGCRTGQSRARSCGVRAEELCRRDRRAETAARANWRRSPTMQPTTWPRRAWKPNDFEVTPAVLLPRRAAIRRSPARAGCWKPARAKLRRRPTRCACCASTTPSCRNPKAISRWPIATRRPTICRTPSEYYQRVYYHYLSGAAASRAAAALLTLKDAMGSDYPAPAAAQLLHRGDRLMEPWSTRRPARSTRPAAQ